MSPWRQPALAAMMAAVTLLGLYACSLNTAFYSNYLPFHDSASYSVFVANVAGLCERDGAAAAARYALSGTTPLPGLETIVAVKLGLLRSPLTRRYGIGLQMVWMWTLAAAFYFYWFAVRRTGAWLSALMALSGVMISGVFAYNGGLSDFRMDLSLYLLFGLSVVLYLITERIDTYRLWVALGFAVALTCLNRATAPVYFLIALGPLVALRLWPAAGRRGLLLRIGAMLIPVLVLAVSFFAYNFQYLYNYYVVWGTDSNAHLPWSQSWRHFEFAAMALGAPLAIGGTVHAAAAVLGDSARLRALGWLGALREVNWKLLYIGTVPALFLAWRGTGLNPFIAMPSAFGWLLFLLAPLTRPAAPVRTFGIAALALACGWNAAVAPARHIPPYPGSMQALRTGIDAMLADANGRGLRDIHFGTLHIWQIDATMMLDVLVHEYRGATTPEGVVLGGSFRLSPVIDARFSSVTPLDWQQIPGATDAAKAETLLGQARERLDYLFLPDDKTVERLERGVSHIQANRVLRGVRRRFLESGEWSPLTGMLPISSGEIVQLYSKRR